MLNFVFSSQLTGPRSFMTKWWTTGVSLLPAHSPLEFPWCTAQVQTIYINVSFIRHFPMQYTNPWLLFLGLYDFHEDTENKLFVLNMPLGQKQASMIFIMPYHLESLDRLEKLLTRKQVDTWLSKMENRAVAISLPKISLEVSHNLQVNGTIMICWFKHLCMD